MFGNKVTLEVKGMHCEKCVARVKEALEAVEGVKGANVSLEEERAVCKVGEGVDGQALVAAIEEAGFSAQLS